LSIVKSLISEVLTVAHAEESIEAEAENIEEEEANIEAEAAESIEVVAEAATLGKKLVQ
jgi:hypothetical protein